MTKNKHEFLKSEPKSFPGGTLHQVTKTTFPALEGIALQSMQLRPGAVREPHYHPNAAQMDFVVSGRGRVGIIGPNGSRQLLDLSPGDVSFVPRGHLHWIENRGDESLHFLLITSHEEPETIELSDMLSNIPGETLERAFGMTEQDLATLPRARVTIGGGA